MASVQISFTLRTSANVETAHLVGSWDSYRGQLPLSRDKSAKPGSWAGTFRFQQPMMQPGKRYWYYYILDGYHVSHDPAAEYTVESTTKRKLNILDVPSTAPKQSGQHHQPRRSEAASSGQDVLVVRGPSPSRIQHPRPSKPYASRQLREGNYEYDSDDSEDEEDLSARLARVVDLSSSDSDSPSSPGSLTSSRTGSTSPSSLSSLSDSSGRSSCSCRRYGITKSGERIKLDCGGHRCGGGVARAKGKGGRHDDEDERYYVGGGSTPIDSESSSSCCSDSDEEYRRVRSNIRHQGIAVRR